VGQRAYNGSALSALRQAYHKLQICSFVEQLALARPAVFSAIQAKPGRTSKDLISRTDNLPFFYDLRPTHFWGRA